MASTGTTKWPLNVPCETDTGTSQRTVTRWCDLGPLEPGRDWLRVERGPYRIRRQALARILDPETADPRRLD